MEAGLPSGSMAGWAHSSGEIPVQAGKRGERGSAWAPWWAPTTLPKPPQAAKGICCLLGRDNTGTVPEPDPREQGKAGMGGQMDGGWMDRWITREAAVSLLLSSSSQGLILLIGSWNGLGSEGP